MERKCVECPDKFSSLPQHSILLKLETESSTFYTWRPRAGIGYHN